jgi:hypothetical protein
VRQAGTFEARAHLRGDVLVLAEHESAQERGLGWSECLAEPARRSLPGRVERALQTASPAPGRPPVDDLDRRVRAAPALVGVREAERRDGAP